jgi:hypothetical protein
VPIVLARLVVGAYNTFALVDCPYCGGQHGHGPASLDWQLKRRPQWPLALFKPGNNYRAAHCFCSGGKVQRNFEENIGASGTGRLFLDRGFFPSDLYQLSIGSIPASYTPAGFESEAARAVMKHWAALGIRVSNQVLIPRDPAELAWGDRCCNIQCSGACRPIGWPDEMHDQEIVGGR